MNIYIFGSPEYVEQINQELEKKDVELYLKGEISVIHDPEELKTIISNRDDNDIFLIDDESVLKSGQKKPLFSKKKVFVDEDVISDINSVEFGAHTLAEAITAILEEIDKKALEELELEEEMDMEKDLDLDNMLDEMESSEDSNESIEENVDLSDLDDILSEELAELEQENDEESKSVDEEAILDELEDVLSASEEESNEADIDLSELDDLLLEDIEELEEETIAEPEPIEEVEETFESEYDFDELNNIDEASLMEAFGKVAESSNEVVTPLEVSSDSTSEEISNLTKAFEELLKKHKKVTITVEVD